MIGVELIGRIRRAYFDQKLPIKEIVRTFSVSRTTVRKLIRGRAIELKYESGVRHNGYSRSCVAAAMTAPTTAFIGSSRRGGSSGRGFRCGRSCR